MHKKYRRTREKGRERVGNLFWSPLDADGRDPEGLQTNPAFLQQKAFKLKSMELKTQDGVLTSWNNAGLG
jgi:hypothetical protein